MKKVEIIAASTITAATVPNIRGLFIRPYPDEAKQTTRVLSESPPISLDRSSSKQRFRWWKATFRNTFCNDEKTHDLINQYLKVVKVKI